MRAFDDERPMEASIQSLDLSDVDHFRRGAPHELFALLRREDPVHWNDAPEGAGFWSVTRHADVRAVSRDSRTFSSSRRGTLLFDGPDFSQRPAMIIQMDPPRHTRHRALVAQGFTPRTVSRLEPFLRSLAATLLEDAVARGPVDLVRDLAAELPARVIAELVGVPEADRSWVLERADRIIGFSDPHVVANAEGGFEATIRAMREMQDYAVALARARRSTSGDDLTSVLLRAEVEGERLSEDDFSRFFMTLFIGGSETTRSAISGGIVALAEHPAEWERLAADPSLAPVAVEEILRWTTPFHYFRRTATRDVELSCTKIREGDRVVMWYSSANRDERVFEEPDRFDVGRWPNDHLSFGTGRHYCLGASLARLELRVLLEEILRRKVRIEPTADPVWVRSNFINSIRELPVSFRPA